MTLEEFEEDITIWEELIEFCEEHDCDICEDIIPEEELSDQIENQLPACLTFMDWTELRDALADIDEYCEFYIHNALLDFVEADSYLFDARKQAVQSWAEDQDLFEESEEELEEETEETDTGRCTFSITFIVGQEEDEEDDEDDEDDNDDLE